MSYKKAVAGQIRPGRKEIVQDRRRKKGKLVFPNMDVSENSGFSPKSSILIGFSIYFHHPFWGSPLFWKPPTIAPWEESFKLARPILFPPGWLVQMVVIVRESSHKMPRFSNCRNWSHQFPVV